MRVPWLIRRHYLWGLVALAAAVTSFSFVVSLSRRPDDGWLPVPLEPEEIQVIQAYIQGRLDRVLRRQGVEPIEQVVLWERTGGMDESIIGDHAQEMLASDLTLFDQDEMHQMFADFLRRNEWPVSLNGQIHLSLPVHYFTGADLDRCADAWGRYSWEGFYAAFPRSGGQITVSRPGFNRSHSLALMYFLSISDSLAGGSDLVLMRRDAGGWNEVSSVRVLQF